MQSNKEERRNLPFNVIYVSFSPRISTPLAKLSLVEYIPLALDKLMVNTMGKRFYFYFFLFFEKIENLLFRECHHQHRHIRN